MPPVRLRVLVSGDPDARFFVLSGWAHNLFIRRLLTDHGVDLDGPIRLLDLGCGCGRIARWWGDLKLAEIHGCDYNPEMVAWTAANLPLVHAVRNGPLPPLPYEDGSFDLVYAFSFFTHLDSEAERAWSRELQRLVKPGGLVIVTTMGEKYVDELTATERGEFEAGRAVVHFGESEGSNLCAAYHPPQHVETEILGGFEMLDEILAVDGTRRGPTALSQDLYLARRNDSVAKAIE